VELQDSRMWLSILIWLPATSLRRAEPARPWRSRAGLARRPPLTPENPFPTL